MLIFGCCVGGSGKFQRVAEPALSQIMEPDDLLVRENGNDGICAAYNRILERARETPECEGVVLLHDDTELRPGARQAIVDGLHQSGVGVVGVVGGADLYGAQWVDSRYQYGPINDTHGRRNPHIGTEPWVDVVDGLLLAVAPRAYATLAFDEVRFPAFHGYDTDYCLTVRDAGLKVFVADIDYHHHSKTDLGDAAAFHRSAAVLLRKWPQWIRPLSRAERTRQRGAAIAVAARNPKKVAGLVRHRTAVLVKGALAGRKVSSGARDTGMRRGGDQ